MNFLVANLPEVLAHISVSATHVKNLCLQVVLAGELMDQLAADLWWKTSAREIIVVLFTDVIEIGLKCLLRKLYQMGHALSCTFGELRRRLVQRAGGRDRHA